MAEERPLLILVDGHALAYRAYYALPVEQFSTSQGEPTNAVYGFARKILDILKENPEYLAISFDDGMSGRDELYGDYKGTRAKMPDELDVQITAIQEMVEAFNIPVLMLPGYEADDVIGTVARQAEAQGCQVCIITGDHDLLQLLSEHTVLQLPPRSQRNFGKGDVTWDNAQFQEKYEGLIPQQLADYKGLVGDTSDNIPGVAGVGDKTARKLLSAYPSLEAIYDNLDAVETRWRVKLEEGREMAFLSKKLATIQRDVPLQLELSACVTHDFEGNRVRELFRRLEFRTLSRDLESFLTGRAAEDDSATYDALDDFIPPHTIVRDEASLAALAESLGQASMIAFDTETTGTDKMQAVLVGISLSMDGKHGYYIPVGHRSPNEQPSLFGDNEDPQQLPLEMVVEALRPAMSNPDIGKAAHNALFDLIVLKRHGLEVSPVVEDTQLAEFVRDPASKYLRLKTLAYDRLQIKMKPIEALIGTGAKPITMARVPIEAAAGYAAADAVVTYKLIRPLRESLADPNFPRAQEVYRDVEMPLIPVLLRMEMTGVLVDLPMLAALSEEFTAKLQDLEQQIYAIAGEEVNVNSYQQLNVILFEKLRLPPEGLKKTKSGGYSLTAAVLEELAERLDHPILRLIMEHRSLAKLLGTYVDALPKLINPETGRVHTSLNQTGAVTGRFSSSNPNLQNIPIRTEEGRRIRGAFIAAEGNLLLSVDYSQIELRILAHVSDDAALKQAFEQGQDIHTITAARVYGIEPAQVSYQQRRFAKAVNFGLMYGMGAFRLARDSDLTLAEADAFIKAYYRSFPGVFNYLENTKDMVKEQGYVQTLYGRRRFFPELQRESTSHQLRARAEREAINMPIQGTNADIIKQAMIALDAALLREGYRARMILQVHDELVLEVPEREVAAVRELAIRTMVAAAEARLDVPVVVEAKVGHNWLDMT